jgi:hypothetical protein
MSPQGFKGKATTSRLEACGPDDGGERTTSPDCPVHGGQADPQPTAQCGEHESATLFPSLHSEHNSAGPAPTLQPDCEPSDGSPDREGLSHDPTLATKGQASSEPATPRSSRTHRTDPAPSSAQPCTPSAETAESTGHTPTQPELSEPSLDSAESSISSGDSLASPELQTEPDTAGSQPIESPCTCTFHRRVDESTSHYATFPLALPTRLIKAMCPERVCTVCGAPSERITKARPPTRRRGTAERPRPRPKRRERQGGTPGPPRCHQRRQQRRSHRRDDRLDRLRMQRRRHPLAHRPSTRPLRRQWNHPRRRTQRITRRHRHRSGFEKRGHGRGPARAARRSVRPHGAAMTKESTIQRNVVRLIITRGGHAIVTRPPGVPSGTPDVVGVYRGRSIGIETKKRAGSTPALSSWRRGAAGSEAGAAGS